MDRDIYSHPKQQFGVVRESLSLARNALGHTWGGPLAVSVTAGDNTL